MEKEKIKEEREIEPEGMPEITPQMVQTALKALEAKGMVHYAEGVAYVPTEKGWKLLMEIKPAKEEIIAYGHSNIVATHTTTFEITRAEEIKKDADCIIAVKANKACRDLSKEMKDALKEGRKVEITIEAGGIKDKITAYGSPALKLTHPEDIVVRKSDFIDNRTLAILADKAANEIKQDLVEKLKDAKTEIKITLEIKP
ncbi:MAG: DUF371 domain-containing protein [Candidatus Aenigmarchaeota archaeon]|nr:DUF371 domain-containing protein [Candidatus Aenigmarchaeota archaeon]